MATKVFEKPIYANWKTIELNRQVSIIPKKYTKYNVYNFATYSIDDSKFVNGILLSNTVIANDPDGRGTINKYEVQLENGTVLKFKDWEYCFKVV